jgi:hypothetical protein
MACYVVNTSASDDSGKKKCSPVLEDYYECLHHKKEVRFCLGEQDGCWAAGGVHGANEPDIACESAGVAGCVRPISISDGSRRCAEREPDPEPGALGEDGGHKSGAWAGELRRWTRRGLRSFRRELQPEPLGAHR